MHYSVIEVLPNRIGKIEIIGCVSYIVEYGKDAMAGFTYLPPMGRLYFAALFSFILKHQ